MNIEKFIVIFCSVQQLGIHAQPCEPENVLEAQLNKTTVVEHGTVPCTALECSSVAKQCCWWDSIEGWEQPVNNTPWVLCKWPVLPTLFWPGTLYGDKSALNKACSLWADPPENVWIMGFTEQKFRQISEF